MPSTKVAPAQRISFGKIEHLAETPDLLGIQIQSFKDFFQLETTPDKRNVEGLFRVFKENFPINDTRNIFMLEFLDYFVDPTALYYRGMYRKRIDLRGSFKGQTSPEL